MMEEPLLLPQYAESLIPRHIQQFEQGMERLRTFFDQLGRWVRRAWDALVKVVSPIAYLLTDLFAPSLPRTLRYSPQTRHYLAIKRRERERTTRKRTL